MSAPETAGDRRSRSSSSMSRAVRFPLGRLVPIISLGTVVILVFAAIAGAVYYERSYKEQSIKEALAQANVLASTVTAALVFGDDDAAQEYVNALEADSEIRAVAVYDASGALVAGYSRGGDDVVPTRAPAHGDRLDGDILNLSVPVVQFGKPLGTVFLSAVTEPLASRLTRYGAIGTVVAMAVLVVGILGAAHRVLGRSNRELAELNASLQAQIVEREKAEEALRQSQKMEALGQLSGGIAHDFNNFLTIIRSNLYLLDRRLKSGNSDVSRFITMAHEGVERASAVTQRILAFSRRQALTPRPVDLSHLIAELMPLLKNSIGESVRLETILDATWWTACDQHQMESVILNLLVNARDAMPNGGRVTIATENIHLASSPGRDLPAGDYVRLRVRDTGIGMTDDVRQRAVDPFFTTKPEGQGTGLGLSMIYGYVSQSQGKLDIESRVGEGTTITILMPRLIDVPEEIDADILRPPAREQPVSSSGKPTVLVVEDEELVRMLAAECFRERDYTVIECGDGDSALRLLRSGQQIDMLMSDIRLPGLDGCRLASYALAERSARHVILVTGYHEEPIPDELRNVGVRVYYKPYDLDELVACADELLRRQKPRPAV